MSHTTVSGSPVVLYAISIFKIIYQDINHSNLNHGYIRGLILAHLSQRLIGELIGYPCFGVRCCCRQPFFKHFLIRKRLANQSQISCRASLVKGETKVHINGPGRMTKMTAIPIYGENLYKSSAPEPKVL